MNSPQAQLGPSAYFKGLQEKGRPLGNNYKQQPGVKLKYLPPLIPKIFTASH